MPLVSKTFGDIITFTRASTGSYFDATGTLQSAAIDSPRFDYDPTTLAAQGFLIEEQRTNSIRNNTMQGAVAGTPGTLPTNWAVASAVGLTTNVIGTGTSNGITYVDLQITGTPSGSPYVFQFEIGAIAAAPVQTWTESSWFALVNGSLTNVTNITLRMRTYTSGSVFIAQSDSSDLTITSTLTRFFHNYASLPATTAFIEPALRIGLTAGLAVNFTLRIGLPQLEQGAFATSVIPTTTTALTRSADVASVNTLSPWYNASTGTLYAETVMPRQNAVAGNQTAYFANAGFTNSIQIYYRATGATGAAVADASVIQADLTPTGVLTANTVAKVALAYAANDFAASGNGGAAVTDTSGTVPAVITQLLLGAGVGVGGFGGWLRRVTFYPRRLSNAELQTITT